ncbi:mucin-associated surface protein (MASP), putative [Trypanosoma cruzi]|nr:mucin-associated surface protein (MASP), putative [Trypanosoma cruzi]
MHATHTTDCVDPLLGMDACTLEPLGCSPLFCFCVFTLFSLLLLVYFCFDFPCCAFLIIFLHGVVRFLHFIGLIFLTKCVLLLLVFLLFLFLCASLHLFLLCVDVLLVCAEGCTQVTGVMAMMMTGRVLLVCALCVLWCGAVFGHAMEDYCGEGGGDGLRRTSNGGGDRVSLKADCVLLSTRMALIKAVEAADGDGVQELVGAPDQLQDKSKVSSPNNTQSTAAAGSKGGNVAVQPPPAAAGLTLKPGGSDTGELEVKLPNVVDTNGGKKGDGKNGSELEPEGIGAGQSSSSGGAVTLGVKELPSKQTSKSNEPSNGTPTQEEDA